MTPPDNAKIYETPTSTVWFDEDGIMYNISKPTPWTVEKIKEGIDLIRQVSKSKKICVISDVSLAQPPDKQVRDYVAAELPKLYKAIAIISSSLLGTILANIFITLKGHLIPIKFFTDEQKAKKWLQQFLYEDS